MQKDDLRAGYPFGLFAVPREQVVRIHASSGTTGKPTVVGYTRRDIDTWAALVARSIRAAGGRRGDMVHIAYGYGLFTGGLGAHYGAELLGCTVVPMSGGQTQRQVQLICDFRPDIIMVTPSYMLSIVEEFVRQGLDPAASSLRTVSSAPNPGPKRCARRSRAARDFRPGHLRPVGGDGARGGERVHREQGWAGHLGGSFLPGDRRPGDRGGAARRRAGRAGAHLAHQGSPAGDPLPHPRSDLTPAADRALDAPFGENHRRSDDMLIIRGVNVFPSQIEELPAEAPGVAPHYQLELTREAHLDQLAVKVECLESIAADGPARSRLQCDLQGSIKA